MDSIPPYHADPRQALTLLERFRRLLQEELQRPFLLWHVAEEGWRPTSPFGPATWRDQGDDDWNRLAPFVAEAAAQSRLTCRVLTPGRVLVVASAGPVNGLHRVVAGVVATTDERLLERLVACLLTRAEQEHELADTQAHLNEFADQVTSDFEELTWLRSLTEHIEVCDLRNDLATVSEAILPPLRELIDAEAVVLFTPAAPTPMTACALSETASFVAGDVPVSLEVCHQIIQQSAPEVGEHPYVCNANALRPAVAEVKGLRNFILVRISRGGKHYGWLLVLNRRILDVENPDERANASCLQDWEFGTFEAGLLNAASIMLGTHARNAELFSDKEQLLVGVMRALINAIDAKDAYTCGHSDRVALFAFKIAQAMQLDPMECQRVYMAGLLHDIGKIGVPDEVLCKPGKLTEEEFIKIKAHPEIGYSILKHVKQLEYVLPGVLHHHESFDGGGYPHGLIGDEIPLHGRILAVADSYDAMSSTRSYRQAMPSEKAERIIREGAGRQWDAVVVEAFFSVIDEIRGDLQRDPATLDGPDAVASPEPLDANARDLNALDSSAPDAIYQAVNTLANA